jgi:RHH-type transcriptional regulator, proline utilization regulon repressor / proline dehydrogenase / delta 1-pyrroline-5-carboxylate dehydrogenase
LHGMGEPLYNAARKQQVLSVPARIYAPVGAFDALLPYLVRRLLENGANTSFLAQIADGDDKSAGNKTLLRLKHREQSIRSASAIFYGRKNSEGVDFGVRAIAQAFAAAPLRVPALAVTGEQQIITNPATHQRLGAVSIATTAQINAALTRAQAAQPAWQGLSSAERRARLCAWGDALEAQMPQFAALAVHEAGKTWPNAVADVREAVDFCRYYAGLGTSAKNTPLGTVCTISPWNFPLAIFTGQVAAALAAGNTVVAKPAEQTPLMAEAGVQAATGVRRWAGGCRAHARPACERRYVHWLARSRQNH